MAARKPPLTRARQAYADERGGAVFYGKPLNPPMRTEDRYSAKLRRLATLMVAETEKQLRTLWTSHDVAPAVTSGMDASLASQARILTNALAARFANIFARAAPPLSREMVGGVAAASKSTLHASLKEATGGLSLKTSAIDPRIVELTKATAVQNVALIKSIPQQYFEKIQGAVMRGIQAGGDTSQVLKTVQQTGEVTKRRADLIARDQTSKAITSLNEARMKRLGITQFEWLHSQGGKEPRKLHKDELNGKVFSFDDPPIIDEKTGERGLPGQLINCRCRMVPVISFGKPKE